MKPRVLILHATGINRDREAAWAVEAAGGQPQIVHVNKLRERPGRLHEFQAILVILHLPDGGQ